MGTVMNNTFYHYLYNKLVYKRGQAFTLDELTGSWKRVFPYATIIIDYLGKRITEPTARS